MGLEPRWKTLVNRLEIGNCLWATSFSKFFSIFFYLYFILKTISYFFYVKFNLN